MRRHVVLTATVLAALGGVAIASLPLFGANTAEQVGVLAHIEMKFNGIGCSPDYWRAESHRASWDGVAPDYTSEVQYYDRFVDWFGSIPDLFDEDDKLLDILWTGGDDEIALARQAAAHLANADAAASGNLPGYFFTVQQVIDLYKQGIEGDAEEITKILQATQVDCPLDGDETSEIAAIEDSLAGMGVSEASVGSSTQPVEDGSLSDFEIWAGLGPLPPLPGACAEIDFDKVFLMWEPGSYVSVDGNDLIFGTSGDDSIDAGGGDDCVVGGSGVDDVSAGAGNDVLLGGGGADKLRGEDGGDALFGDSGADRLWGGAGDDGLDGGSESDLCAGDDGENKLLNCEPAAAPTGLKGTYSEPNKTIELSWDAKSNAGSYSLFVSTDGANWSWLSSTESTRYSHIVTPASVYHYTVSYTDSEGFESQRSAAVMVKAGTPTPTPSPTPTPTSTPTVTSTPQATRTPATTTTPPPTSTPEPTATQPPASPTPTPMAEPSPDPTATEPPAPEPSPTAEPTADPGTSSTPEPAPEPSSTP